jgi:hypothetical protein
MDKLNYENEYGRLSLEIVNDLEPVGNIQSAKISDHHKISINNGEEVALLTEGRYVQMGIDDQWRVYIILHKDYSNGYVCKILKMDFNSDMEPAQIIDELRPRSGCV